MPAFAARSRSFALLMLSSLACGCPASEAPRYTRLEAFTKAHAMAKREAPLTFEVRFFDAAGAPVEPGWFQWLGAANPLLPQDPSAVGVTREEHVGVRRVTLVPHAQGRLSIEAIARPCPSCAEDHLGPMDFWVSAEADHVVPLHPDPSSMVVGEQRPFTAIPYAVAPIWGMADGPAMRTPDAALVTVADASIATVDAHGVVTAIATGTTTLTFASGAAKASIRLDVVAGSVAKPAVGAHPILGVKASVSPKIDHLLVVDDREWPTYVTTPWILSQLLMPPAIVARWTGSGFGAELVGEPLDAVSSPSIARDARDARDARGRTYVTFKSASPTPMQAPTRIAVAERAADGGPADWT